MYFRRNYTCIRKINAFLAFSLTLLTAFASTSESVLRLVTPNPTHLYELRQIVFPVIIVSAVLMPLRNRAVQSKSSDYSLAKLTTGLSTLLLGVLFLFYGFTLYERSAQTIVYGYQIGPTYLLIGISLLISISINISLNVVNAFRRLFVDSGKSSFAKRSNYQIFSSLLVILLTAGFFHTYELDTLIIAILGVSTAVFLSIKSVPMPVTLVYVGLIGLACKFDSLNQEATYIGGQIRSLLEGQEVVALSQFLLMGVILERSGFIRGIYLNIRRMFPKSHAAPCLATILSCSVIGSISGSSLASISTLGRDTYRELDRKGYPMSLSLGCATAGSTLGVLIPPSTLLLVYSASSDTPILDLYLAAIVPVFLSVLLYIVTVLILVSVSSDKFSQPQSIDDIDVPTSETSTRTIVVTLMCLYLSFYGGLVSLSEVSAVGVFVAFFVGVWKTKRRKLHFIWSIAIRYSQVLSYLFLLIVGATLLSSLCGVLGIQSVLESEVFNRVSSDSAKLMLVLATVLVAGMVMDPFSVIIIIGPVLFGVIGDLGYTSIWWGIVLIILCEVALVTPPVGLNLLNMKNVTNVQSTKTVFLSVSPFLVADMIRIILLIMFPVMVCLFID